MESIEIGELLERVEAKGGVPLAIVWYDPETDRLHFGMFTGRTTEESMAMIRKYLAPDSRVTNRSVADL
jgi:hypothetical protein